ncbi:hypothetical protein [Paraburkholderia sp. SIMBA_030]|uniref:hypothetical protein n=2 Tax=Pseudomonadati TaxID=3379134 RepID=UPI003978C58E
MPDPIRVSWLIIEFGERHRPGAIKVRRVFNKEIGLLVQSMQEIGDPLVADLGAAAAQTFRTMSGVGRVRTESLIRRLRQIWRWAVEEGLTARACPWVAFTQDRAIRAEMVTLVVRYLPDGVLQTMRAMTLGGCVDHGEVAEEEIVSVAAAVRQAARHAGMEARRDGRPDLVPTLRRCDLQWFLEAETFNAPHSPPGAGLILGHARTEVVLKLRKKVASRRKINSESNHSERDIR